MRRRVKQIRLIGHQKPGGTARVSAIEAGRRRQTYGGDDWTKRILANAKPQRKTIHGPPSFTVAFARAEYLTKKIPSAFAPLRHGVFAVILLAP